MCFLAAIVCVCVVVSTDRTNKLTIENTPVEGKKRRTFPIQDLSAKEAFLKGRYSGLKTLERKRMVYTIVCAKALPVLCCSCVLSPSLPQVQLLHREGAAHSPAAAAVNGGTSRIDTSTIGQGGSDTSGGPNSTAREKRFTELLNARVSEERHVQVTVTVYHVWCLASDVL